MQKRHLLYVALSIVAAVAVNFLGQRLSASSPQIPNPEAAARQAEQLSPEQLTQLEVDEAIRDRLRTDPAWQPITQAIRQDIMFLKWGDGKLENPAWQRYGAKAYPLFDYYSHSSDPIRQKYGLLGIRYLGKPYTTLWLTRHLQQRHKEPDIYLVTSSLENLVNNAYYPSDEKAWEKEFGLDDPATRDRLVKLARQNLNPPTSPSYYDQFNLGFLTAVLGYEKAFPSEPSVYDPKPPLNLPEWFKFERLTQPSQRDIQTAIAYYRTLSVETQEQLLVEHLGAIKADRISPIGKALLQNLAADPNSPDKAWAIAELNRHDDSQGAALLQQMLDGDLKALYPLTRVTGYESISLRNTHAYYLLLGMAQKYPQSKFIQGCRDYGDLTGKSYFDKAPRNRAILERNAQKTPAQNAQDWQQWLSRYSDHPGADDATYHLARSLQAHNDVMGAMRVWIKLMTQPMGDGDAAYLAWPFARSLLDVGLSVEQIETLLKEPNTAPIKPLLQYAVSVRSAREQNYTKALQTSAGLDLTAMPSSVLGSYYNSNAFWWARDSESQPALLQKQMQAMLGEQRQRWQRLLQWQQENTPDSQYRLASDWAGAGGWKNGYLAVWEGRRAWHLPTENCKDWWVCDLKRREANLVRSLYQNSSQNAVALSLYQSLLDHPRIPPALREKTLYMEAATLLWQWENHPIGETRRIHPPAGVLGKPQTVVYEGDDVEKALQAWEALEQQMQRDYQRRVDAIVAELQSQSSQSSYIDDLLFSSYYLSGEPRYLQQIVQQYPQSDRAAEAKFLLAHQTSRKN
jgi:DNA-binding transcriptional MerR regulator